MDSQELRSLVETYQPNAQVLTAMSQIKLLATVGPTASGKTTVMAKALEISPELHHVLDETSRPPRPKERAGIDFVFRTQEEILDDLKQGLLVQIAVGPNGHLYCTRPEDYPQKGIGIMPLVPVAVREFRKLPIAWFKAAFIVPASYDKWQQWLTKRADESQWTTKQVKDRLAEARLSYEFSLADKDLHFILNDTPTRAAERLLQVARGETPEGEEKAQRLALENLKKLKEQLISYS